MPRLDVPADRDPLLDLWTRVPALTAPAAAFSGAVYSSSTLPLREFEVARSAIAGINQCVLCIGWRSGRDVAERAASGEEVPEELYAHAQAGDWGWEGFSERERLAGEFASRFATDHLSIDDDLWKQLHAAFTGDELVELGLCVGAWIAFGRLNQVFDVDGGCRVP
jgi:alkylhydroperoxidase family enzyme